MNALRTMYVTVDVRIDPDSAESERPLSVLQTNMRSLAFQAGDAVIHLHLLSNAYAPLPEGQPRWHSSLIETVLRPFVRKRIVGVRLSHMKGGDREGPLGPPKMWDSLRTLMPHLSTLHLHPITYEIIEDLPVQASQLRGLSISAYGRRGERLCITRLPLFVNALSENLVHLSLRLGRNYVFLTSAIQPAKLLCPKLTHLKLSSDALKHLADTVDAVPAINLAVTVHGLDDWRNLVNLFDRRRNRLSLPALRAIRIDWTVEDTGGELLYAELRGLLSSRNIDVSLEINSTMFGNPFEIHELHAWLSEASDDLVSFRAECLPVTLDGIAMGHVPDTCVMPKLQSLGFEAREKIRHTQDSMAPAFASLLHRIEAAPLLETLDLYISSSLSDYILPVEYALSHGALSGLKRITGSYSLAFDGWKSGLGELRLRRLKAACRKHKVDMSCLDLRNLGNVDEDSASGSDVGSDSGSESGDGE